MNKLYVCKVLVFLLTLNFCIKPVYANEYWYATEDNVEVFNKNGSVCMFLSYAQRVSLIKRTSGTYAKIKYKNKIGYVKLKYLSKHRYDGVIRRGGNARYQAIKSVDENYNLIDKRARDTFQKNKWNIYCVSYDLSNLYDTTTVNDINLAGIIKYRSKTIYVEDSSYFDASTVIHEFGHWIDYMLNNVSDSNEFRHIYNSELELLVRASSYRNGDSNIASAKEYFAECYRLMHVTTNFDRVCPKTYKFLKQCEKECYE